MKKIWKIVPIVLICAFMSFQISSFAEIKREDYKTDYDYYTALAKETIKSEDYATIDEYNMALKDKVDELTENAEKEEDENPKQEETQSPEDEKVPEKSEENDKKVSRYPQTVLEKSDEQREKYKFLKDLGIMDFGEDFDTSISVTRGEYTAIIASIYNGGEIPEGIKPKFLFSDINETSSVYNAICSLINGGIILGYDDGTYREENIITQEEALIIATNLLGFDNYGALDGDKYGVYMSLIDGTDLAKYFRNSNSEITRGELINIIYELLFTNTMRKTFTDNMRMGYAFTTEPILYKYYNYMFVSGIVSANEFTSLITIADAVSKNSISVNGTLIFFEDRADIYEYLGYYVTAIYDEAGNGKAIKLDFKKNSELLIEAKDIENFNELTYRLDYYNEKEKLKYIDIKPEMTLIFNGAVIEDTYDSAIFMPSNGKLSFIDNDRDGEYEILKIDLYVTYAVESVTTNGKLLNDSMGLHDRIDLSNRSYKMIQNGELIDYSNLKNNSVIMVAAPYVKYKTKQGIKYMSPDISKCNFYKIVAVDSKISGKKNGGNSSKIIFEGKEYEISKELGIAISVGSVVIPNNGTVFEIGLDLNGDVAYVNTSAVVSSGVTYAFLKKMGWDEDTERVYFKAFDINGVHLSVILPEKVYVYRKWTNGSITTNNYYKKKIDAEKLVDKSTVPELFKDGEFVPQLIKYSTNSAGEIDTVYVAVDTFDGTMASLIKEPVANKAIFTREFRTKDITEGYQGHGYMMYHWYRAYYDITTFITIPGDLSRDDLYKVSTKWDAFSSYVNSVNGDYDISGYDADEDCDLKVVVMREPSNLNAVATGTEVGDDILAFQDGIIVDSVNEIYDDKTDEVRYQLEGYQKKNKVSYYFENAELLSNTVAERADLSNIRVNQLKKGDIIWIAKNSSGNISGFTVLWHDVLNESAPGYMGSFYEKPLGPTEQTSTSYRLNHNGIVTDVGKWSVYIKAYDDGYLRKALCDVGTNVYLLSGSGNRQKIQVIDFSDIQPGDYVKTKQTYVTTQEILVIRK